MTITTTAGFETAINTRYTRYNSSKTAINPTNAGAGFNISFWQSNGIPSGGGTPSTTATVLDNTTPGAIPFMQQTSPRTSYLGELAVTVTSTALLTAGHSVEIHDRLIEIAFTVSTTTQTLTGFDLNSFLSTSNIDARKGDSNYSDVQWWIENTAIAGTNTAVSLTINVTYNDGTTGNITILTGYLNFRQGRMFPLNYLIPGADSGKYIRGINSVTSTASVAGSVAFVATRYRACVFADVTNKRFKMSWSEIGNPEIYNQSCLFPIIVAPATTIGNLQIEYTIVHG